VEGHHESAAGKTDDEIGNKTYMVQVLWIEKKIIGAITRSNITGDDPEHDCPKDEMKVIFFKMEEQ